MNRTFSSMLVVVAVLALVGCNQAPATPPGTGAGVSNAAAPLSNQAAVGPSGGAIQLPGISVSGEGIMRMKPDLAEVQVGVEMQAPTAGQAQQQAADAMASVVTRLRQAGVDPNDVRSVQVGLQPNFENLPGQQRQNGFRAFNTVVVSVRRVEQTGQILDALVASGANRIEGVSFTLADPTAAQDQARDKAVADARRRAEHLAKLAGVQLGQVVYLAEGSSNLPPRVRVAMPAAAPMAAASTPVEPGQLEIHSSVQAIFSIK